MARQTLPILLAAGVLAADIFVSPDGSGSGAIDAPFGSIQDAVDAAAAGDTIFLREGTYAPDVNIQVTKSGSSGSPIVVRPYEGEAVVVDGENMPGTPKELDEALPNPERGIFHIEGAEWWEFYDLE
jgi:hypothetical protein